MRPDVYDVAAVASERRFSLPGPAYPPARMSGRVSVVMPTLNEAENVPYVIPRIPRWIYELIIVDGLSTDATVEVARSLWPNLRVVCQTRRGKGNALACGLAECRGAIVVMIDSDGSTDPVEIPRFVDAIEAGADFVKGSRFLPGGGSDDISPLRNVGNWLLTRLVNLLFGTSYTDSCYGFNALRAEVGDVIGLDADGFEIETLMSIRAAKAGLVVVEVPSWERRRIHGASRLNAFRDGWRVMRTIFRERWAARWRPQPALADALVERVTQPPRGRDGASCDTPTLPPSRANSPSG